VECVTNLLKTKTKSKWKSIIVEDGNMVIRTWIQGHRIWTAVFIKVENREGKI